MPHSSGVCRESCLPPPGESWEWKDQRSGLVERLHKGPSRLDFDLLPGPLVLWFHGEGADWSL